MHCRNVHAKKFHLEDVSVLCARRLSLATFRVKNPVATAANKVNSVTHKSFDRDECIGEDMDYDVFLCCSSRHDRPHALRILELIESNGYRVCYHERDYLAGTLIMDNMFLAVVRSKRTVCLISNSFLRR